MNVVACYITEYSFGIKTENSPLPVLSEEKLD